MASIYQIVHYHSRLTPISHQLLPPAGSSGGHFAMAPLDADTSTKLIKQVTTYAVGLDEGSPTMPIEKARNIFFATDVLCVVIGRVLLFGL